MLYKKIHLLIDIDGVIRNCTGAMLEAYKKYANPKSKLTLDDIKSWEISKLMPEIDFVQFMFYDHPGDIFLDALPIPETLSIIDDLYEKFFIHFVTAQRPHVQYLTLEWLRKYNVPYDAISFTNHKHIIRGHAIIDDYDKNLKQDKWRHNPAYRFLLTRPWNRDIDPDGVTRINSLKEFADLVMDYTSYLESIEI